MAKQYLCIDLKSFYASVECIERGLDPLTTNLVVADASRTEKTICLAVTPALKSLGISGRARLFEVVQQVRSHNNERKRLNGNQPFTGSSYNQTELLKRKDLEIDYIAAPPRMAYYMQYSTRIYSIYLKYVAPEDIHVYSIDEVFMDITNYLETYKMTAYEMAMHIIRDVLQQTGITATAGIGTNLYLAKIAMDIVAKKMPADKDGVRIAALDEQEYKKQLWTHQPLTDFWRIGKGYAKKLESCNLNTMGDIARLSTTEAGENLLYKMFGINAELLIDHAWGYEPCTIQDIKGYTPESKSISSGQVLHSPYPFKKARLIVQEMLELLALELVEKRIVTDQIVLTVGYDIENLTDPKKKMSYTGEVITDFYGRKVPKHAHGTANIGCFTSLTSKIIEATLSLFDQIVNPDLLVRRVTVCANHILPEGQVQQEKSFEQLDLFTDYAALQAEREQQEKAFEKERKIQEATIKLRNQFGKNAVLKGMNLQEGATTIDRNKQIGGHKA